MKISRFVIFLSKIFLPGEAAWQDIRILQGGPGGGGERTPQSLYFCNPVFINFILRPLESACLSMVLIKSWLYYNIYIFESNLFLLAKGLFHDPAGNWPGRQEG